MTGPLSESQALKQPPAASARKRLRFCVLTGLTWLLLFSGVDAAETARSTGSSTNLQIFEVKGVVLSLDFTNSTVTVRHEAVSNYMPAMTMPFHVKTAKELEGLKPQDVVTFRLLVTDDESWVDRIRKVGTTPVEAREQGKQTVANTTNSAPGAHSTHPLLDYKFTNELGQAVSLNDFRGQALGITFFFTRCPVPDYCPRLSKNFSEASQKLSSMPNAPTNWHFLSISFDPTFDTPEVLKAYARRYQYDPTHWNFLTGPEDKIKELARLSGVETKSDVPGLIDHNFRTLIIDAASHLQTTIPFGGDFSQFIAKEMIKAAAAVPTTNSATVPADSPGAAPQPSATTSSR